MEDVKDLFSHGKFPELLTEHLKKVKNISSKDTGTKRKRNIDLLYYLLEACIRCGCYCDYLNVLKKLNELTPIDQMQITPNIVTMVEVALEALVYCLYNNDSQKLGIEFDIKEKIEDTIVFSDHLILESGIEVTPRQVELRNLYQDYLNGKTPVYTVEYLYPFHPITMDYCFTLPGCDPVLSMEVKEAPREGAESYISFKFRIKGLIKPDAWWMGPRWQFREKNPTVKNTIPFVNAYLLQAVKASPGKMVMPYGVEQVSTVSLFQYRWNEKDPVLGGTITSTDFSAKFVGGNAAWHTFSEDEMPQLNAAMVSMCSGKPFVTTFHHAMNLISAGFNLEGFLLLCSACEGMVYHWCGEIAELCGKKEKYERYSETEQSMCDKCGYYTGEEKDKPYRGIKPSLFSVFSFLAENQCITGEEKRDLGRLLSKVRIDDLRNSITHGKCNEVSKDDIDKCYGALMAMQNQFIKIENRLVAGGAK